MTGADLFTNEFVRALQGEGDRACAILGSSMLDELLSRLLRRAMLEDAPNSLFEGNGPLATFSSRIKLAFYFGLISAHEHRDLDLIRRIRNDFAHKFDHNLRFDISPMADRVRELYFPSMIVEHEESTKVLTSAAVERLKTDHRHRFEVALGCLAMFLEKRAKDVQRVVSPQGLVHLGEGT